MNDYERSVRDALWALRIRSLTGYYWFGKSSSRLPSKLRQALTSQDARNYLLHDLTSRLYTDFYLRGTATPSSQEANHIPETGMTPFVAELSAANSGNGYWDEGWRIDAITDDFADVLRGNLRIRAPLYSCMSEQGSVLPRGELARVRFPKEFLGVSPGFYMALSDTPPSLDDGKSLVRIYWNLNAEAAVPFIRMTTKLLNQVGLAFKLKISRHPALFTRCDAAVVYVSKRDYHAATEVLGRVYAEVRKYLKLRTPAFTKPLAPGVGCAEDPGAGESFGQNRCRLVADAAIRAFEQGKISLDDRLQIVTDRYAEEGLSLAQPFLNPGSEDTYSSFVPSRRKSRKSHNSPRRYPGHRSAVFLNAADELGRRLAQEAFWQGNQCNWLGAEPVEISRGASEIGTTYSALGPDLYGGTSGVALFLAELYANSGTDEARHTAMGAIQQALDRSCELASENPLGLYTGSIGIAYAAARVGTVLKEQGLISRASELLNQCVRDCPDVREFDILSGYSGAILALLSLRKMLNDQSLLNLAVSFADKLVENAESSDAGCSWKSPRHRYQHNLTGFSHGTAGIGLALLELSVATGNLKFRAVAEQAFAYERSCFDPDHGNWPDFRDDTDQGSRRERRTMAFATTWCHGAPGIGLARLRAYELTKDAACKYEASVALRTTYESLRSALDSGNWNFSLCHGIAGQAEVLLYGRRVMGMEFPVGSTLAFEAAEAGTGKAKRQGGAWPCGIIKGETPSLLVGLAGIGYFYLRLHNPEVPPVLLLQ